MLPGTLDPRWEASGFEEQSLHTSDMAEGRRRSWRTTVILSAVLAGPALGDEPVTFEARVVAVVRSTDVPATIAVIRLHHAKAEELAATLSGVLPPDVKVVPDIPTNSLIVSVRGASLAEPMDRE
jgi:hypothetical protein